MGSILYYLIIFPISILPYFLLNAVSTFIFWVLYYLLGYRKSVIKDNIYGSFTSKSKHELDDIVKEFYKHFADLLVEVFKNFTISEKQIRRRVVFENVEVLDNLYDQNKSVIIATSHQGNWEMLAMAIGDLGKHKQLAIYKPLKDEFLDKKMKRTREKLGLEMFPMADTIKYFRKEFATPVSIFFASDQWPSNPKRAHWTRFLNRETPVLLGAEQYAKLFDWPVVYCEMIKKKRGHYSVRFETITETPKELEKGEIMNQYCKKLEETIQENPAHWLWSHRRWKRTKEEVFKDKN